MARRKPHLFELLGRRDHGDPALKRTPARPDETVGEQFQRMSSGVAGFVRGLFRQPGGKPPATRTAARGSSRASGKAPAGRITLGGPALAGVAFLFLAIGFGLGSWLARPAMAEELRMGGSPGEQNPRVAGPERPQPLPDDGPRRAMIGNEAYTKKASNLFFPLLLYSPSQEQAARDLVDYLWENAFDDARLLSSTSRGQPVLVVVVHTISGTDTYAEAAQQKLLDRLKTLQPPAFEPRLAKRLADLTLADLRQQQK